MQAWWTSMCWGHQAWLRYRPSSFIHDSCKRCSIPYKLAHILYASNTRIHHYLLYTSKYIEYICILYIWMINWFSGELIECFVLLLDVGHIEILCPEYMAHSLLCDARMTRPSKAVLHLPAVMGTQGHHPSYSGVTSNLTSSTWHFSSHLKIQSTRHRLRFWSIFKRSGRNYVQEVETVGRAGLLLPITDMIWARCHTEQHLIGRSKAAPSASSPRGRCWPGPDLGAWSQNAPT